MKGKRIRLIRCLDPFTKLRRGSLGTITRVEPFTISVKWDDGSSLSLLPDIDEWEVLDD